MPIPNRNLEALHGRYNGSPTRHRAFFWGVVGGVGKFGRAKKGSCSAKCLGQKVIVEHAHEKTNMVQGLCCEMR